MHVFKFYYVFVDQNYVSIQFQTTPTLNLGQRFICRIRVSILFILTQLMYLKPVRLGCNWHFVNSVFYVFVFIVKWWFHFWVPFSFKSYANDLIIDRAVYFFCFKTKVQNSLLKDNANSINWWELRINLVPRVRDKTLLVLVCFSST